MKQSKAGGKVSGYARVGAGAVGSGALRVSRAWAEAGAGVQKEVVDLSSIAFAVDAPARSKTQRLGAKERSTMRNVALDLGTRKISFCEVSANEVVVRRTVTSLGALDDLLGKDAAPARVAVEACREAWHVHGELTKRGHEVLLVDTSRVRQLGIGQHGRKTDRIDAEVLARAVERGTIPVAHLLSPERQQLRKELGVRRALVETRAQYVVIVRGLLRADGITLGRCDTEHFVSHVRRASLSAEQRQNIAPLVLILEKVNEQLVAVDARLETVCAREPAVAALTTTPGVGLIVAAAFVSVIDEAKRFRHAHQVQAYVGLVPSENSSGERRRIGSITKHGNGYLRSMLVQAAWSILRTADRHDPLRVWAEQVAERRGKRIAVVALARRLAGVLWAIWRDGTVYDAAWIGQRSQRGLERQAQEADVRAAAMKRAAHKAKVRMRPQRRRTAATTPA